MLLNGGRSCGSWPVLRLIQRCSGSGSGIFEIKKNGGRDNLRKQKQTLKEKSKACTKKLKMYSLLQVGPFDVCYTVCSVYWHRLYLNSIRVYARHRCTEIAYMNGFHPYPSYNTKHALVPTLVDSPPCFAPCGMYDCCFTSIAFACAGTVICQENFYLVATSVFKCRSMGSELWHHSALKPTSSVCWGQMWVPTQTV